MLPLGCSASTLRVVGGHRKGEIKRGRRGGTNVFGAMDGTFDNLTGVNCAALPRGRLVSCRRNAAAFAAGNFILWC